MSKINLVKSKHWTWKSDVRYYLYRMPLNIILTIPAILRGEPKINDMTWRDYIDLAKAMADAQYGRMWYDAQSVLEG